MRKYHFTASTDGNNIDYETVLFAMAEPDFWTCYELAAAHGCNFFTVEEAGENENV